MFVLEAPADDHDRGKDTETADRFEFREPSDNSALLLERRGFSIPEFLASFGKSAETVAGEFELVGSSNVPVVVRRYRH